VMALMVVLVMLSLRHESGAAKLRCHHAPARVASATFNSAPNSTT
jgi:hypothetical protein